MRYQYYVKGMTCAACVAHVERAASGAGFENATVNLMTGGISLESSLEEEKTRELLTRALRAAGYDLMREKAKEDGKEYKKAKRSMMLSLFLSALIMVLAMWHMTPLPVPRFLTIPSLSALLQMALTCIVVLINFKYFKSGFPSLLSGVPNMDSLIAVGSGASLLYSVFGSIMIFFFEGGEHFLHELYFDSAAMILSLVSLGKFLENRAKKKAGNAIVALSELVPSEATVKGEVREEKKPVEELLPNDMVIVKAGDAIPVDGEILFGEGSIDESSLTGESMPIDKKRGDRVCASCILRDGYLEIRVTKASEETSIKKVIRLLEQASMGKAEISRFADKIAAIFVPAVMAISLLSLVLWLVFTKDISMAIRCAVSVLVISCPCALGLATPTAITVGTGVGASHGILIRSPHALELLGGVKYLLTDKTGTLTHGSPSVTASEGEDAVLLKAAYSLERLSTHPLGRAICRYAETKGSEYAEVEEFESITGKGLSGVVDGVPYVAGKSEFLAEKGMKVEWEARGSAVFIADLKNKKVARFNITDPLKIDSKKAIKALSSMQIQCVMLTGDNASAAADVAEKLGMESYHASLLPEDKEEVITEYRQKGITAMVGDGINDAPALMRADVGIAVGAGTEIAIDSADVILQKNSMIDILTAISLSRATMRIIKGNLFWALIYNSICIPIAAGVLFPFFGITLSPMLGALAMSFSSVCVVCNSLRLRRFTPNMIKENKGEPTMNKMDIDIEGMMCMHCAAHVKKALEGVAGVVSAKIDLEKKKATVEVEDGFSLDAAKEAVNAAGYQAL